MHITQEPLHEVVCVLLHFHCICTVLWQQNYYYCYYSFAAIDKLHLQNKDMSVCACVESRTASDSWRIPLSPPVQLMILLTTLAPQS